MKGGVKMKNKDEIIKELIAFLKKHNLIDIVGESEDILNKSLNNMSLSELLYENHELRRIINIQLQLIEDNCNLMIVK